jgi:hypothetical protein
MRIHSKQEWPGSARYILVMMLFLFSAAGPATAQVILTNVSTANVTPDSFSIIGAVSGSTPFTNITISVFADPGGVTSLSAQLGIELYPLNTGDPSSTNSYLTLLSKAALSQDSMALGLVYARVCYCVPNTTYYYRVSVSGTNGQTAVWPASGPLPAVTTAQGTSFVLDSQQLLLTLNNGDPPGSIILLSNTNSSSVLAAVVGDGVATNQIFFNLSDLIAATGNTNYLPLGNQQFTATVLGTSSNGVSQTYTLNFSTEFVVGQAVQNSLGDYAVLSLGSAVIQAGQSSTIPISLSASSLTNFSFVLSLPTNRLGSFSIQSLSSQLGSASLQSISSNTLSVSFIAGPGQTLAGDQEIAQLNFTTVPNQPSAFIPFAPQSLSGVTAAGSGNIIYGAEAGQLVVIGTQSLLAASTDSRGNRDLALYGNPWRSYEIQYSTNFMNPSAWNNELRIPMTNLVETFTALGPNLPVVYYRAVEFAADPPLIEAHLNNKVESILVYGRAGTNYVLQYSTNLSGIVAWYPSLGYQMTNSFQTITNPGGNNNPIIFYRVKRP